MWDLSTREYSKVKKYYHVIDSVYFPRPFGVSCYFYNVILNYIKQSLILVSVISGCVSISAFASLVGIPIGITS